MEKPSGSVDIISPEVHEALKERAKKKDISVRQYVNELLSNINEANKTFQKMFPHLEIVKIKENASFVDDTKKDDVAKVSMHDGKLSCSICEENLVCDHITLTLANKKFWAMVK